MKIISVDESYQTGYSYSLDEPVGKHFDLEFKPELTPQEMLNLGIFGGAYFRSKPDEFPPEWFKTVELSLTGIPDPNLNYFHVLASSSLAEWQRKGWIYQDDPLGWFLWYCRYFQGRRIAYEDARQIKRWKAISRHIAQVKNACQPGDEQCRPRQRQAILHWAYDSRKI